MASVSLDAGAQIRACGEPGALPVCGVSFPCDQAAVEADLGHLFCVGALSTLCLARHLHGPHPHFFQGWSLMESHKPLGTTLSPGSSGASDASSAPVGGNYELCGGESSSSH